MCNDQPNGPIKSVPTNNTGPAATTRQSQRPAWVNPSAPTRIRRRRPWEHHRSSCDEQQDHPDGADRANTSQLPPPCRTAARDRDDRLRETEEREAGNDEERSVPRELGSSEIRHIHARAMPPSANPPTSPIAVRGCAARCPVLVGVAGSRLVAPARSRTVRDPRRLLQTATNPDRVTRPGRPDRDLEWWRHSAEPRLTRLARRPCAALPMGCRVLHRFVRSTLAAVSSPIASAPRSMLIMRSDQRVSVGRR